MRGWLRTVSSAQLMEWEAFSWLEPFGEDREDVRFGMVVQTLREANRNRKARDKPYTLEESIVTGGDLHEALKEAGGGKKDWRTLKFIMSMWRAITPGSTDGPKE